MVQACINSDDLAKAIETVERSKSRNLVELLLNQKLYPKDAPPEIREQLDRLRREVSAKQRLLEQLYPDISLREDSQTSGGEKLGNFEQRRQPYPSLSSNYLENVRQELIQAQQQLDALLNRIKEFDPNFEFTQRVKTIDFESIRALLDRHRAIIQWYITSEGFYAFIITSTRIRVWQSNADNLQALTTFRDKYLTAYQEDFFQWAQDFDSYLDKLAQILHLDALLAHIPDNCQQLILIPYRELHLFPIHALSVKDRQTEKGDLSIKSNCLLDIFPSGVQYAPSCQLWQISRTPSPSAPLLLREMGEFPLQGLFAIQNPTEDLNFTNIEVNAILGYFDSVTNILSEQNATKEALNQEPTASQFRDANYLHFACHGSFNFLTPLLSNLILAGAIVEERSQSSGDRSEDEMVNRYIPWREGKQVALDKCYTLGEIFALNLPQCRLVTLSACETGLTTFDKGIEEYISLPSGFIYAGVLSVICSLWSVSDLSTALLMIKFYQNLQYQTSVAVALNQAQIWLRDVTVQELLEWSKELQDKEFQQEIEEELELYNPDEKCFSSPLHWAAFCAIGQ
ncbi:MAG: CHAT domain-containing protein [Xenococcaceae cyanobacterium]